MQAVWEDVNIISVVQKLSPSMWHQPKHRHPFAEVAVITEGVGVFTCNHISISVARGDVILIPPDCSHRFQGHARVNMEYSIISFEIQDPASWAAVMEAPNGVIAHVESYLAHCGNLLEMIRLLSEDPGAEGKKTCLSLAHSLLQWIKWLLDRQAQWITREMETPERQELYNRIYMYISENCTSGLKLQDIAEHFHMSQSQLSHNFTEIWGCSPIEHMIRARIYRSSSYLVNTDKSVEQIAELFGYSTPALYIRQFSKRMGCTPMEYKNKRRMYIVRFSEFGTVKG